MKHATWPLRIIADSAEMEQRVVRQLFDTKVLKFRGDDQRSTGTGTPVRLSKNRAYEASVIRYGKLLGLPPSRSALAAFQFTISGNAERPAGSLFKHGTTKLIIGPHGSSVRNVFSDATLADISDDVCTIYIDLNRLVRNVDAVLNSFSESISK